MNCLRCEISAANTLSLSQTQFKPSNVSISSQKKAISFSSSRFLSCFDVVGGDRDLFEFFDEHPEGVSEPWAVSLLYPLMKAIVYMHGQHICHRDLKPENILVSFNPQTGNDTVLLGSFVISYATKEFAKN